MGTAEREETDTFTLFPAFVAGLKLEHYASESSAASDNSLLSAQACEWGLSSTVKQKKQQKVVFGHEKKKERCSGIGSPGSPGLSLAVINFVLICFNPQHPAVSPASSTLQT